MAFGDVSVIACILPLLLHKLITGNYRDSLINALCVCVCVCGWCRDLVHRQTASWAVKHMSLGVYGFGCEDALTHLLNYVWPNIFETSPHMVQSFNDAVDGLRVALGPSRILQYTLQVRSH